MKSWQIRFYFDFDFRLHFGWYTCSSHWNTDSDSFRSWFRLVFVEQCCRKMMMSYLRRTHTKRERGIRNKKIKIKKSERIKLLLAVAAFFVQRWNYKLNSTKRIHLPFNNSLIFHFDDLVVAIFHVNCQIELVCLPIFLWIFFSFEIS